MLYHGNADAFFSREQERNRHETVLHSAVPEKVDWRKKGVLSAVMNQGSCGSCYAIASAGMIAAAYRIHGEKVEDLSSQQIMDCSTEYGNSGCEGGTVYSSFQYVRSKGITTAKNYPYVGKDQECQSVSSPLYKLKDIYHQTSVTEKAMQEMVSQTPVAISIYSSSLAFQVTILGTGHV